MTTVLSLAQRSVRHRALARALSELANAAFASSEAVRGRGNSLEKELFFALATEVWFEANVEYAAAYALQEEILTLLPGA